MLAFFPYITHCKYTLSLHCLIPHFTMTSFQCYFYHPTSIFIAGQDRSGKTCFVFTCLEHSLIQPFPTRIRWFYKEWQPIYDRIKEILRQIEFSHGMNNEILEKIQALEKNLVVLVDLLTSADELGSLCRFPNSSPKRPTIKI